MSKPIKVSNKNYSKLLKILMKMQKADQSNKLIFDDVISFLLAEKKK